MSVLSIIIFLYRNNNNKDFRNFRVRFGHSVSKSDDSGLNRRWKRDLNLEKEEQLSTYISPTLTNHHTSEKLAERFRQRFSLNDISVSESRRKRQVAEPIDHVAAIMEDIRKEMHSLEVSCEKKRGKKEIFSNLV